MPKPAAEPAHEQEQTQAETNGVTVGAAAAAAAVVGGSEGVQEPVAVNGEKVVVPVVVEDEEQNLREPVAAEPQAQAPAQAPVPGGDTEMGGTA